MGVRTGSAWVPAAHVLELIPLQEALGLGLRGRATGELLVEANNTLHAVCVGSAANSLSRSSQITSALHIASGPATISLYGYQSRYRMAIRGLAVIAKGDSGEAKHLRWG